MRQKAESDANRGALKFEAGSRSSPAIQAGTTTLVEPLIAAWLADQVSIAAIARRRADALRGAEIERLVPLQPPGDAIASEPETTPSPPGYLRPFASPRVAGTSRYQGTRSCSKKKLPVGPEESKVASQTIPAAACSTVR